MLYTLSGVDRSAFERFPMPRNTAIFAPTFNGEGIVRLDDVLADPRYGHSAPYHGMPEGHLPVRSYLAVPVITSDGEVVGGLFFGHPGARHVLAPRTSAWSRGSPRSRRSRSRTRASTRSARARRRRCSARCCRRTCPRSTGLELAASYRAAGEGNEVGGDFYDVFPQGDGSWALVVGDVCGKGPQAAAVTALARYTLRAHAVAGLRPSYQLARLNDALLRQQAPGFVTVALARLELTDGRRPDRARDRRAPARRSSPARTAPRRRSATSARRSGSSSSPELPEVTAELGPGDLLAFYTDGVSEAAAPRRLLTEHELAALVAEQRGRGPARRSSSTWSATAVAIADGNPRDDIACLALQVTPPRRRLRALPGDAARRARRRRRARAGRGRARPAHGAGPAAAGHRAGRQRRPPHRRRGRVGRGPAAAAPRPSST